MEGSSRIPRPLRPDSALERQACDVRVQAWIFVFRCWHSKKGAHDVVTVTRSNPSNTGNGITKNGTGGN